MAGELLEPLGPTDVAILEAVVAHVDIPDAAGRSVAFAESDKILSRRVVLADGVKPVGVILDRYKSLKANQIFWAVRRGPVSVQVAANWKDVKADQVATDASD